MNSGNFTGRLTADPEIRRTNDGTAVCSFTLAVKRPMTKDTTDFIDFVAWRQSAEYLNNYAHKGDLIAVTGYIQVRNWKDKEDRNRKSTEVVAQSLEICASKRADQAGNSPPSVKTASMEPQADSRAHTESMPSTIPLKAMMHSFPSDGGRT